jgi:hypothetical protein
MPIYCEVPLTTDEGFMSYQSFIYLERIPTAEVLLRVTYSSIDYEGNFISIKDKDPQTRALAYEAAPDHHQGAYSTVYYLLSQADRDLYQIRKQRTIDVPLAEVMEQVCKLN